MKIACNRVIARKKYSEKEAALRELRSIPGVGKSISIDLRNLGINSMAKLKNKNPEVLYQEHCAQVGQPVDRCLLYVFRCAVYYTSNRRHNSKLLLWWNWKDEK